MEREEEKGGGGGGGTLAGVPWPCHLSTHVQAVVTKVTADFDRWTLMQANEPLIVHLQATWRGVMVRRPYQDRLNYLQSHQEQAVKLQAYWKGHQQKKAYKERLAFLKQQAAVALRVNKGIMSWIPGLF